MNQLLKEFVPMNWLKPTLTVIASVLVLAFLSGCASMRTLSSTPPVKSIFLDQTAEFTFGLGTKLTMPAGEYKPVLEDKSGYYYQAPSKVAARDIFSYIADGGLFVKRGDTSPSRWYVIDQQNYVKSGKLPENFKARITE